MPAKRRFTETWLKSLVDNPPASDTTYSEAGRVGFLLRHRTGGALVWLARYQRDARPVWLTLGEYPAMSLDGAHEAHAKCASSSPAGSIRRQSASGNVSSASGKRRTAK